MRFTALAVFEQPTVFLIVASFCPNIPRMAIWRLAEKIRGRERREAELQDELERLQEKRTRDMDSIQLVKTFGPGTGRHMPPAPCTPHPPARAHPNGTTPLCPPPHSSKLCPRCSDYAAQLAPMNEELARKDREIDLKERDLRSLAEEIAALRAELSALQASASATRVPGMGSLPAAGAADSGGGPAAFAGADARQNRVRPARAYTLCRSAASSQGARL